MCVNVELFCLKEGSENNIYVYISAVWGFCVSSVLLNVSLYVRMLIFMFGCIDIRNKCSVFISYTLKMNTYIHVYEWSNKEKTMVNTHTNGSED